MSELKSKQFQWCRIFESEKFGQILATKQLTDEDTPSILFQFFVDEGFGNAFIGTKTFEEADALFDSLNIEIAEGLVTNFKSNILKTNPKPNLHLVKPTKH